MIEAIRTIGWVASACGLAGAGYAIACVFAANRFARATMPGEAPPVPVSILKPLYGAEADLAENLESFCRQDYGGAVQLLFGVQTGDHAAHNIAAQVKAMHPELDIAIVTGTARPGTNPKICNLINTIPAAKHHWLAISDSDIRVAPQYLGTIMAAAQWPGTGAVTCCYTGRTSVPGLWARLSAMGINQHFLPDVLFSLAYNLAAPCFGSTIALNRRVLTEIGGLQAFADRLADDYEIGRAVRARGYAIAVPPLMVAHSCSETTASALIRHELRWARTIRLINPPGFFGSIVTHALPMSLIGCLLLNFSAVPLAILAVSLAARLWLAVHINTRFSTRDAIWLVPVRDLLSFAVFFGALFASRVEWRGARFRVSSAGAMAQD